jgi:hypothetical protein
MDSHFVTLAPSMGRPRPGRCARRREAAPLSLRALRIPHGAAVNLHESVNFYNQRFRMALSEQQKSAFLNSL